MPGLMVAAEVILTYYLTESPWIKAKLCSFAALK